MEPPDVLEMLTDEGILEASSETGYRVSNEFQDRIDHEESELRQLQEDGGSCEVGGREVAVTEDNAEFLARVRALEDATSVTNHDVLADVSLILSWFLRSQPRQEGSPEQFLPIHGDQLPVVIQTYSPAVLYVWLDDCEPCDLIKSDFEGRLSKSIPDDVSLFSVYGPAYSEFLQERYDIVGGPMLLFVANNQIDSRLHGAHEPEVVEREMETIRDRDETGST